TESETASTSTEIDLVVGGDFEALLGEAAIRSERPFLVVPGRDLGIQPGDELGTVGLLPGNAGNVDRPVQAVRACELVLPLELIRPDRALHITKALDLDIGAVV